MFSASTVSAVVLAGPRATGVHTNHDDLLLYGVRVSCSRFYLAPVAAILMLPMYLLSPAFKLQPTSLDTRGEFSGVYFVLLLCTTSEYMSPPRFVLFYYKYYD